MSRLGLASAALMISATILNAQITTYVAPPRPLAASPQAVATADSVKRDSVQQATMTNMKAWVDSAAGVTIPARVGTDSSAMVNDPGRPEVNDPARPEVTTFSNGTVAPATASDLPTLAVLGAVLLLVGAGLLVTRPRS